MKTGDRNRLITIERKFTTTDDFGGEVETWAEHAQEWAAVSFGTGQERREAAQENASLSATFQVLANTKTNSVTVQDRIAFDGATWDISSVVPSKAFNEGRDITATRAA